MSALSHEEAIKKYGKNWFVGKQPLEIYYMTHPDEMNGKTFEEFERETKSKISQSIFQNKK